jgi:hypothetical protein
MYAEHDDDDDSDDSEAYQEIDYPDHDDHAAEDDSDDQYAEVLQCLPPEQTFVKFRKAQQLEVAPRFADLCAVCLESTSHGALVFCHHKCGNMFHGHCVSTQQLCPLCRATASFSVYVMKAKTESK